MFWGVIGLSGAAILTGALGLALSTRAKGCCSISLYAFMTLLLTLGFLAIGGLLMAVTVAANRQLDAVCSGSYDKFTVNVARYFLEYADQYQLAAYTLVSAYMCTSDCPCAPILNQGVLYPQGFRAPTTQMNFNGTYTRFSECYKDLVS